MYCFFGCRPSYSTALVLWKPPSGVIHEILKNLPPAQPKETKPVDNKALPKKQMQLENSNTKELSFTDLPMSFNDHFTPCSSFVGGNFEIQRPFVPNDVFFDNDFEDDMMEL